MRTAAHTNVRTATPWPNGLTLLALILHTHGAQAAEPVPPPPPPSAPAFDGGVAPGSGTLAPAPRPLPYSGPASCARLDHEQSGWLSCIDDPPLDDVIAWAQAESELFVLPAHEVVERARSRGALPVVRLRGRFDDGESTDFDPVGIEKGRQHDADYGIDVTLEWDFADLAGSAVEAQARRELRDLHAARQAIAVEVTQLYYDRRRIQLDLLRIEGDESRTLERRLRLDELDASLDALTGGRWSDARRTRGTRGESAPGGGGSQGVIELERRPERRFGD